MSKTDNYPKYNRLALKETWLASKPNSNKRVRIGRFICDCGKEIIRTVSPVKIGIVKSCGCLKNEKASQRMRKMATKHGEHGTRLYRIYRNMINRCHCESDPNYHNYGGRGILVCDSWKNSVQEFIKWAKSNGYSKSLTLDRRNNNLGYSPNNCRWETRKTQANNRRSNKQITAFGETKTISQWVEDHRCQVAFGTLQSRLNLLSWPPERAIQAPSKRKRHIPV